MSRMSGLLSTSVPSSAGVRTPGGSYCTATGWRFGSRPCRRQSQNIKPNTPKGMSRAAFANRKSRALSAPVGRTTTPGFQAIATVTPSRKFSARVVSTVNVVPTPVMRAAASCDP